MIETRKANRLINSASPYLLQHAYNPVDWYEWTPEALERARNENKPILVSIGYSSCHWCHVMEREVFEKDEIASLMNERLICIKVDREERPDIDQIYMDAVQAMGVQGGWPLNVFLTPEQKPFYGGTYFPPDQWTQVVHGVHNAYSTRRDEVEQSAGQLADMLADQNMERFSKKGQIPGGLEQDLKQIHDKLKPSFDVTWGGLDKAPKFIMPSVWRLLLRYSRITGDSEALGHVIFTLKKIAMGGIYDQIGGGFSRYSVDKYWFVPHFEKMLYDNAQLMTLYSEAFAATGDEEFKTIVNETFEWLQTEMMNPRGGFYSALDADSEGEEGKFYAWTSAELSEVLGEDSALINEYYSIKSEGNWEPDKNVLIRIKSDEDFLKGRNIGQSEWRDRLRQIKHRLLAVRDKRVRPGLDDKIIAGWNAMMIVGLTDAYRYIGDKRFLNAALQNMRFMENEMMEGLTIFRSFKDKRSHVHAFLDDYAYMILACVNLYQVTFDEYWIQRGKALMDYTISEFFDEGDGFFFYASRKAEKLIATRKEILDNVIPASNSVMAQSLLYLGTILDIAEWKDRAAKMADSLNHLIVSEPNFMSNWGIVHTELKKGLAEVAITGRNFLDSARDMQRKFTPFSLYMGTEGTSELPLLADKKSVEDLTIYVCFDKTCRRPVHTVEDAMKELKEN